MSKLGSKRHKLPIFASKDDPERWTNRQRLDWLTNLRDMCRDKFKDELGFTDQQMAEMDADIAALEKALLTDEFNAAHAAARDARPLRESARMLGELIDDSCANDYYKARRMGLTDEQIDQMRHEADRYAREVGEWERRQQANMILGVKPRPASPDKDVDDAVKRRLLNALGTDDTKLRAAFDSGDEQAVDREFKAWTAKLEAKAEKDPTFAKWFETFCKEQEALLRWDDTIGAEEVDTAVKEQ